jgi:hypothetical protein
MLRELTGESQEINSVRKWSLGSSLCRNPFENTGLSHTDLLVVWHKVTGASLPQEQPQSDTALSLLRPETDDFNGFISYDHEDADVPTVFLICVDNLLRLGLLELNNKLEIPMPGGDLRRRTRASLEFESEAKFRVTPLGHLFVKMCSAPGQRHSSNQKT